MKTGRGAPTFVPISWRRAASSIVTSGLVNRRAPHVVCVFGGSGGGKNVFTRFLTNSILFSVGEAAIIDGDCTHPELASPGMVSFAVLREPLAAPGATHYSLGATQRHDATQMKSFFVGSSPKVILLLSFVPRAFLF